MSTSNNFNKFISLSSRVPGAKTLGKGYCKSEALVDLRLEDSSLKYSHKIRALVISGLSNEKIIDYPAMKELNVEISPKLR